MATYVRRMARASQREGGKRVRGMLRALDKLVNREERERGAEVAVAVAVGLAFDARALASLAL
jgi:hypothetical protein